jgi:cytochrome P450
MHGTLQSAEDARARAYSMPLEDINVGDPQLFFSDSHWPYFERLRKEDPVHYCRDSEFGPYWSVTKYHDIMAVETNHQAFSSDSSLGTPTHLDQLASTIRERACLILDSLPRDTTFNWVHHVSVELTTQMLATLFDFPWEERSKLTYWSDVATAVPGAGLIDTIEQKQVIIEQAGAYFKKLWDERFDQPPKPDLLSMMAHSEATRNMDERNFLGNIFLLIIGGNDTTRNSLSGAVYALNKFPDQYRKLRENPALIESFVPEVIRWQTPLSHMRRTALADTEIGGKQIKKGDKVVMWYVSGNRDEDVIEKPDEFIVDRKRPRNHLSFGFGIHRCVGLRLAELQLKIVWEEILKRFEKIELVEEPKRVYSSFIKGYETLPVRIAA